MVKVEIDVPAPIYGFLKAVAIFVKNPTNELIYTEEERKAIIDKYIKEYIEYQVVDSVRADVNAVSVSPFWSEEDLKGRYGLDEVDP